MIYSEMINNSSHIVNGDVGRATTAFEPFASNNLNKSRLERTVRHVVYNKRT